jgi:peptide/nickel transport system permease protein
VTQIEHGRAAFAEPFTESPLVPSTFSRILKYFFRRLFLMVLVLAAGLYLAVVVVNYGGFIDKIIEDNITNTLIGMSMGMSGMPAEEKLAVLEQAEQQMRQANRLDEPFLLRCLEWTWRAATFNWELRVEQGARGRTGETAQEILEKLPNTLLLAGSANLLLFVASVFLALILSRRYGSLLDKLVVTLSPLSSVPNWIYGILLLEVFAVSLGILPFGGISDPMPPETRLDALGSLLRHLLLPISAIFLSTFFKSVYAWRTFFLINAEEDYVELGRAKGLSPRMLERFYILRPTLPFVVTSFTILLITFWQEVIALEVLFNWPGIGAAFLSAMRTNDRDMMLGLIVIFAYLLALTVILLDLFYAWIDPRVESPSLKPKVSRRFFGLFSGRRNRPALPPVNLRPLSTTKGETPALPVAARFKTRGPLGEVIHEIRHYPAAILGLVIILLLTGTSVYTLFNYSYEDAVRYWRGEPRLLYMNPLKAQPVWVNWFRREKLPETIRMDSTSGGASREQAALTPTQRSIVLTFPFEYTADGYPQDMAVYLTARFDQKQPLVSLYWVKPDGTQTRLTNFTMRQSQGYILSQDQRLKRRLRTDYPLMALFGNANEEDQRAQPGTYQLRIEGIFYEEDVDLQAEVILHGQVYGLAGTDHQRRDLMMAILWGTPIAMAFGLLGAVGTTISTMLLASIGVWFGGWLDDLIQRITEIVMILPVLPMALMVYYIYSKSIWAILGVVILLNLFGNAIKNYRAIFLQVRESGFVEAAQVYGTGNARMISHYLIPRILPVMVPQLVILVPGFIFLEATLAYLGVSDLYLPTWGKVIKEAITIGAFQNFHYWYIIPISLLLITGLAFAMLGFSLDRVFNARLKDFR